MFNCYLVLIIRAKLSLGLAKLISIVLCYLLIFIYTEKTEKLPEIECEYSSGMGATPLATYKSLNLHSTLKFLKV